MEVEGERHYYSTQEYFSVRDDPICSLEVFQHSEEVAGPAELGDRLLVLIEEGAHTLL